MNKSKLITISNFSEVKNIVNVAQQQDYVVGVQDTKGAIANAQSILGLMSLDYSSPVTLVSDNEAALEGIAKALS